MRAPAILAMLVACGCGRLTSRGSADASPATSSTTTSSAATPVVSASATSTIVASPEKWCAMVFETNRKCGYMVGNQYKLKPTDEEFKCDAREVLANREKYVATTPTEIRADVEKQIAWFDSTMKWAESHGGKVHGPGMPAPPPGFVEAEKRLYKYQLDHCGLNPKPL